MTGLCSGKPRWGPRSGSRLKPCNSAPRCTPPTRAPARPAAGRRCRPELRPAPGPALALAGLAGRFAALFRDVGDDELAVLEAALPGHGGQFVTQRLVR